MASAATTLIKDTIGAADFGALDDAVVDTWVEIAALVHAASTFGNAYTVAMAYYAAHLMMRAGLAATASTIAAGGAAPAGAVSSVRDLDLSVVFDTGSLMMAAQRMAPEDVQLLSTPYGQQYMAIRNTRAATGPRVVFPSAS